MKTKILLIAGARPNYMKIAPIYWAIRDSKELRGKVEAEIIHTGQHYDAALSDDFFRDLDLPAPAVNLGVGSGSHAEQTARVMTGFEKVLQDRPADVVLVVGDVNSTAACAMVTAKAYGCTPSGVGRPLLAHVEAGLRSRDRAMPEEVNRLVTDALSDVLLTTSADADANLSAEGVDDSKITRVGNTMIDSLLRSLAAAEQEELPQSMQTAAGLRGFGLCTLHRPSNVDDRDKLTGILEALSEIAAETPLFIPLHPRTRARIEAFGLESHLQSLDDAGDDPRGIYVIEPLSYLQMLLAQRTSSFVLTDSGGLQEETTALGIPCVTIRENTERPITITEGSNVLAGTSREGILRGLVEARQKVANGTRTPDLWDGHAGRRIVEDLVRRCQGTQTAKAVA